MILLLGANGQVGYELQRTLATLGMVQATTRAMLDLEDASAIRAMVRAVRPTWIVNAAAYTAVDAAESDAARAQWLNADVPRVLGEEASMLGAWVVHYSTDYVFDGLATRPYVETDAVAPRSAYGRTKADGEDALRAVCPQHLLFRVAWVYGNRGRNFLRTMQRLAAAGGPLRVVHDQWGVPTWSRCIAEATAQVMAVVAAQGRPDELAGTYHLAGRGACTWYDFACAIIEAASRETGHAVDVQPITTADYPTPAVRPAYSVLDASLVARTFGVQLPSWEEQLALCLADRLA